jgi:uncharacterized protein YkwD
VENAVMSRIIPLVAFIAITPAFADDKDKQTVRLIEEEQAIFDLTNKAREKEKLPPLKVNAVLVKVARAHSENMAKQEKMAHELDGKNPSQRIKDSGYAASWGGENVAEGEGVSAEEIFKMWMESKEHRENILRKPHEEIGVGIAKNAKGVTYYTQVFAAPKKRR